VSETPPRPPAEPEPQVPRHRLDPDRAAAAAGASPGPEPPAAIDTRPYRWMIGIFGLVLVIAISVYQFARNGTGTVGVGTGKRVHLFVAPLATSSLNLDANADPRCDPADPNPQGLNVCGRSPLVLGFFVTGSVACKREVDTLQEVSHQFAPGAVQFAAVAVHAGRSSTDALVRSHHWTIPVAYDRDGAIGDLYGVAICPMVELAYRGGIVADRLIGEHWLSSSALSARVHALLERK
jgi:AhpC/TSA family